MRAIEASQLIRMILSVSARSPARSRWGINSETAVRDSVLPVIASVSITPLDIDAN